jgi:hypothetical protein
MPATSDIASGGAQRPYLTFLGRLHEQSRARLLFIVESVYRSGDPSHEPEAVFSTPADAVPREPD